MRELRGDNINAFVAFFIGANSPFRPPAVIFEYSSRGSLMDLIDKEEIKLDWAFKVSFLTDLIRGLKAIQHSAIKFHGRLTSRKCVIDTRWTLKITDYGINRLEVLQNGGKSVENLNDEQLLWTAPEVLRSTTVLRDGSPKGDVYSFAIIMQEVILRGRPFCTTELTAKGEQTPGKKKIVQLKTQKWFWKASNSKKGHVSLSQFFSESFFMFRVPWENYAKKMKKMKTFWFFHRLAQKKVFDSFEIPKSFSFRYVFQGLCDYYYQLFIAGQ